ncbi:MAG: dTDP-4-dehydrorhamnose reductase [Acidimicrobiales bacterium]|nr:dTDP-4-dehydrorhamnose reductase [Acidimicrobiales bacterium]
MERRRLMRVLITGAGGALGQELVAAFADDDVVACGSSLDVGDRDQVLQALGHARPDTVVHAGAWTDVDGCEADRDRAFRVNALGTRHVVAGARLAGARVCYFSTDYVFDGEAGRPYVEWDAPNPRSVYGMSKRGGELEVGPEDVVVRTSWLSGRTGRNFVRTIIERARTGQTSDVVDDQHGCPTFTEDLAGATRRLAVGRYAGVFHVTNQGITTWFELARETVELAGLDPDLVRPIPTAELQPPRAAPRPRYSALDNAALRLSGLPLLDDYHEPLARLVKELAR